MRIALIAPPWVPVPPPSYGGTETVIDGLARALLAAGHDVFLFATRDSTAPVERAHHFARALGVHEQHPDAEREHVAAAYRHPGVRHADIVHDHTLLGPAYGAAHSSAPVVTTAHGPFLSECGRHYAAVAGRVPIIAISHHQASTAAGHLPVAAVIHHGIDLDAIRASRHHGGYALFLGRMHPDKGVAVAARIAREAGVPLVIAAKMREPIERQYFEAEVRPLLGGSVEFVGEVGASAKCLLLHGALALLNPIAWAEPFGMVMIEALACGTPVVAPPVATVPELVTDGVTGIVGPVAELAARLPAAADLDRRACRDDAERRFSLERVAVDHARFYERVLAGDRPASAAAGA
jgi:glycosyltransferase involved in cell wall biosynthesis